MNMNRSVTASFTAWYFATANSANPASGESYVYGSYGPSGSYSFVPYPTWPNHIYVLLCDLDSDGRQDLITGVGPGGGPHIKAFSANAGGGSYTTLSSVFVADVSYSGGVQPIACLGNRVLRVQFGNGEVQEHTI